MRRTLICLALSLSPPTLGAQGAQRPTPVDTAKLTFAWPARTTARVEARKYRERKIDAKDDTTDVQLSYRMTAVRAGQEYVVRFDDFRLPDGAPPGMQAELSTFANNVGALVPAYRVSATGDFTRLESADAIRALLDSMIKRIEAEHGPIPPQATQVISNLRSTMMSDAVLAASAAQEWNALVGTWTGAELEVGEVYANEGEEPIPIVPGSTIKFRYEFAALRRMSCDSVAAPTARDCIQLQMVSKPDSAAMHAFLSRLMHTLMPDSAKGVVFTEFNVENVVTLVARPETLLPISLEITKEVTGAVRSNGKLERMYQLDVRWQRYLYDR
jgi:hypothetical protein